MRGSSSPIQQRLEHQEVREGLIPMDNLTSSARAVPGSRRALLRRTGRQTVLILEAEGIGGQITAAPAVENHPRSVMSGMNSQTSLRTSDETRQMDLIVRVGTAKTTRPPYYRDGTSKLSGHPRDWREA